MQRSIMAILLCILLVAPARPKRFGARAAATAGAAYAVNSTADAPDADPADGVCADAGGRCTLRAAIMQANFITGPNTITVPSGVYLLTRAGLDDAALVGDLDIADDLTLQGAGSASTIVDGNGAVTGDRVIEVLSPATVVTLQGLTIRSGKAQNSGGGLYVHAGDASLVDLIDIVLANNTATFDEGGGLAADFTSHTGSIELDHVAIRGNSANNGGGLAAFLALPFAHVVIRDSQIYSNAATGFNGGGIDIHSLASSVGDWVIENSQIYSNTAVYGAGLSTPSTGSLHIGVFDGELHDNHASYIGGAILTGASLVISRTAVDANTASDSGGGIYTTGGPISSNQLTIVESTLSGNSAPFGAGLYQYQGDVTPTVTTFINSTVSDNTASHFGGGIYANSGQMQLFNSTIAGNQVIAPVLAGHGAIGAGLYITETAIVTASNTLLAYNSTRVGFSFPAPDDCFGPLRSRGFNLIQAVDNCTVSGATSSNITGQDPLLGPLAKNGGPTQTRALLAGSPAIDGGQRPCMDAHATAIATDQRGFARFGGSSCDIGAFEYYPPGPFLPLVFR